MTAAEWKTGAPGARLSEFASCSMEELTYWKIVTFPERTPPEVLWI